MDGLMSYTTILLFLSGIIFNLFNWLYQTAEIKYFLDRTTNHQRTLNLMLIGLQITLSSLLILLFTISWVVQLQIITVIKIFSVIFSLWYLFISGAFTFAGLYFYRKLVEFSAAKAQQMKKRIIWSVTLISSTFFIRGWFNLIRVIMKLDKLFISQSLKENTIYYPLFIFFYFTIVDILPIWFQMLATKIVIDHYQRKLGSINSQNFGANITDTNSGKYKVLDDKDITEETTYLKETIISNFENSYKDSLISGSIPESQGRYSQNSRM